MRLFNIRLGEKYKISAESQFRQRQPRPQKYWEWRDKFQVGKHFRLKALNLPLPFHSAPLSTLLLLAGRFLFLFRSEPLYNKTLISTSWVMFRLREKNEEANGAREWSNERTLNAAWAKRNGCSHFLFFSIVATYSLWIKAAWFSDM